MLNYEFFYNVATYANNNWKGKATPREIACNAYEFLISFEESKANDKANATIESLLDRLLDDILEECRDCQAGEFYKEIAEGIYGKENTKMFMTDLHKTELLEKAIAYINDNDMLEEFIEDTGVDFTDADYDYFEIEKPESEYEVELTETITVKARSEQDAVAKAKSEISVDSLYAYIDGVCIN